MNPLTAVLLRLGLLLSLTGSATAAAFDHVGAIQSLNEADLARGGKLYAQHCAACHGADGDLVHGRRNDLAHDGIPPEVGVNDRYPVAGSTTVWIRRVGRGARLRGRSAGDLDCRGGR